MATPPEDVVTDDTPVKAKVHEIQRTALPNHHVPARGCCRTREGDAHPRAGDDAEQPYSPVTIYVMALRVDRAP